MSVTTAIWDPVPLVCSALCDALGDDADVVTPACLPSWAGTAEASVAVVSIVTTEDWALLRRVRAARHDLGLVMLLDWTGPAGVRRALELGASAAMPRTAATHDIVGAVDAVRHGYSVVPRGQSGRLPDQSWSEEDRAILEALVNGATVTELAFNLGYSRRTAARRLRRIYDRLGVIGASQATAAALRLGLVA